jgi:hypothetical protein
MHHIPDTTRPRYRLPFEELPRGFVHWPRRILDGLEAEQERRGLRFADEHARQHLVAATLGYFYDGLDVAYCVPPRGASRCSASAGRRRPPTSKTRPCNRLSFASSLASPGRARENTPSGQGVARGPSTARPRPATPVARIAGAGLVKLSRPCWADTQVGLTTSWATGWQPHLRRRKRLKQSRRRRTSRLA